MSVTTAPSPLSQVQQAQAEATLPPRDVALAVIIAAVWGVNFVVIDMGLRELPPLFFATVRFILVAFPAVLLVRRPRVPVKLLIVIGLLLGVGQFGLLFVSMDLGMPAGLASLVLQCQAIFTVALAAAVIGERPSRRHLAGGTIALAGLGVVALGRGTTVPLVPLSMVVGAAAMWGASNVATRIARPESGLALIVWAGLVPPLPLLALSIAIEGPVEGATALAEVGPGGIFALVFTVVAPTLFGYGAWSGLLQRHPASLVAPFSLLVPVFGIASAWLLLAERPSHPELAGGLIILAGLVAMNASRSRRRVA